MAWLAVTAFVEFVWQLTGVKEWIAFTILIGFIPDFGALFQSYETYVRRSERRRLGDLS